MTMAKRINTPSAARGAAAQSGNALFLILIAVALFAALSYAVTQSGRGSGTVDKEQDSIYGAQAVQAAGLLRTTVQRMVLNGIRPDQIKIETAQDSGVPCSTGDNCVWAFSGISATPYFQSPPGGTSGSGWWMGELGTYQYYVPSLGTAAADLGIWMGPVSKSLCKEINKRVGLGTADPLTAANTWTIPYSGAWDSCFVDAGDGLYYYFSVFYPQ